MPDIQTEMQKILQAWEEPQPQPEKPVMFTTTTNVSQNTFNYIRDHAGSTRVDCIKALVQLGYKKSSVSSLIVQMLRQGLVVDSNGGLHTAGDAYQPLKSAQTLRNKAKRAKTSKVRTSTKDVSKDIVLIAGDRVQEIMDTISLPDAKRLHKTLNEYFGSV